MQNILKLNMHIKFSGKVYVTRAECWCFWEVQSILQLLLWFGKYPGLTSRCLLEPILQRDCRKTNDTVWCFLYVETLCGYVVRNMTMFVFFSCYEEEAHFLTTWDLVNQTKSTDFSQDATGISSGNK